MLSKRVVVRTARSFQRTARAYPPSVHLTKDAIQARIRRASAPCEERYRKRFCCFSRMQMSRKLRAGSLPRVLSATNICICFSLIKFQTSVCLTGLKRTAFFRHWKELLVKRQQDSDTSDPILGAVSRTYKSVKTHTSRVYSPAHLKGLYGTGPSVSGVGSVHFVTRSSHSQIWLSRALHVESATQACLPVYVCCLNVASSLH